MVVTLELLLASSGWGRGIGSAPGGARMPPQRGRAVAGARTMLMKPGLFSKPAMSKLPAPPVCGDEESTG